MKKCRSILSWLLILSVCLICCSALADGESNLWYCPQCGRLNDANFCPVDGIPKPDMSSSASSSGVSMLDRFYDYYPGTSVQIRKFYGEGSESERHQSYAGPGSSYSTAGAYKPYKVTHAEAFFEENGFVFVHLEYQTVADRFLYFRKSCFRNLPPLPSVDEWDTQEAVTLSSITPSWGPGKGYSLEKEFIAGKGIQISILFEENDYVYAEYQCARGAVRMWLPKEKVSILN